MTNLLQKVLWYVSCLHMSHYSYLWIIGGRRANTIHYISNNQIVGDGDMVLMDSGCEYHGYSSDIARTWPVNGKNKQGYIENAASRPSHKIYCKPAILQLYVPRCFPPPPPPHFSPAYFMANLIRTIMLKG